MSVYSRWTGDVGDRDLVWRYLLEKLAHTALIAWVFACLGIFALYAALAAAIAYNVIGKAAWLYGARQRAIADNAQKLEAHLAAGWTIDACWDWVLDRPRYLRDDGTAVDLWFEARDTAFDQLLGFGPAIASLVLVLPWYEAASGAIAWTVAVVALFNNRWSSPGNVG